MFVEKMYLQLRGVGTPTVSDSDRGGDLPIGHHVWISAPVVPGYDDWALVLVAGGLELCRRHERDGSGVRTRLGRVRWDDNLFTKWIREHEPSAFEKLPRVDRITLPDGAEIDPRELTARPGEIVPLT